MARALTDPPRSGSIFSGDPRWGDLRTRVISAAVLVPLALSCLWWGGWPWQVLVIVAAVGMADEWRRLCRNRAMRPGFQVATGALYILPACATLLWLRADPTVGLGNVLFVLLIVWASDIGAYLVGRLVGGARLAPAISPGKTWSGAVGGLAAAGLVGLAAAAHPRAILVAIGLGVLSQAGDLLESALKRHFGVKDSGFLIPGHGGLFDRLDGLLAAAPAAGLLAVSLGRGVELWR